MASKTSELACTYAALILHDEGVEITQDKIAAIVQLNHITPSPPSEGKSASPFLLSPLEQKRNGRSRSNHYA